MSKEFLALAFDWETTGLTLHPKAKLELQPRAIEFGGVLVDRKGAIKEEFSYIIDPGVEIEPIITKITGLTNEDLRGKPKFAGVYKDVKRAFSAAALMIAHNLPFDRDVLTFELQRLGIKDFPWPQHGLCTVQANLEEWGRRPKLTELYEKVMGAKLHQTHRASDDCAALIQIVVKQNLLELFV